MRIAGPPGHVDGDALAGGLDERPQLRIGDRVAPHQHRPDVHLALLTRLAEAIPAGCDLDHVVQTRKASRSAGKGGYGQLAP